MIKRLFPNRWARITAWTAAAVAWSVSVMAAALQSDVVASAEATEPPGPPPSTSTVTLQPVVPTLPESGLRVLRFTPVDPPPPEVITRTVEVRGSGGGGGGSTLTTVPTSGS
jgi:hypothetical protein